MKLIPLMDEQKEYLIGSVRSVPKTRSYLIEKSSIKCKRCNNYFQQREGTVMIKRKFIFLAFLLFIVISSNYYCENVSKSKTNIAKDIKSQNSKEDVIAYRSFNYFSLSGETELHDTTNNYPFVTIERSLEEIAIHVHLKKTMQSTVTLQRSSDSVFTRVVEYYSLGESKSSKSMQYFIYNGKGLIIRYSLLKTIDELLLGKICFIVPGKSTSYYFNYKKINNIHELNHFIKDEDIQSSNYEHIEKWVHVYRVEDDCYLKYYIDDDGNEVLSEKDKLNGLSPFYLEYHLWLNIQRLSVDSDD